jgi:hypothetical protein
MAPNTTPTKKAKIMTWKREGRSHQWIREHLTGRNEISDRQIIRIFNRYNEKENYYDVGHKTGRPHKMNERETRNAARQLASGRAHDATHLREEFFSRPPCFYGEKKPQGVGTSCPYSPPRATYYCAESKETKGVGGTALGVDGGKLEACNLL